MILIWLRNGNQKLMPNRQRGPKLNVVVGIRLEFGATVRGIIAFAAALRSLWKVLQSFSWPGSAAFPNPTNSPPRGPQPGWRGRWASVLRAPLTRAALRCGRP